MLIRIMILTLFLVTACTANRPPGSVTRPDGSESPKEAPFEPTTTLTPAPVEGLQKKFTQLVMEDLATRLDLKIEAIRLVSVESIEWPNAALGCPAPGKVYAQGTVPGFRIRLEAEGKEYSYHTDRRSHYVLCTLEDPGIEGLPVIPVTPGEIDDGEPWMPVD